LWTSCWIHATKVAGQGNGAQVVNQKEKVMRKAYVNESSITSQVEVDLGEVSRIIDLLVEAYPEDENKNWQAREIVKKLRQVRRDIAEEARREFESMLERS
jgi:hypothetical protein